MKVQSRMQTFSISCFWLRGTPLKNLSKRRAEKFKTNVVASCDCNFVSYMLKKKFRENTTSSFSKSIIHLVVNRTQLLKITFCVNWPKYKFLALCRSNRLQSNSPSQPASCYVSFDEFLSGFIVIIHMEFSLQTLLIFHQKLLPNIKSVNPSLILSHFHFQF